MKTSKHLKKVVVFEKLVELNNSINFIYFEEFLAVGIKSLKNEELELRRVESKEEDISCLLYTSGTTGNPKGVIMSHVMFNEVMRIHLLRLPHNISDTDTSLAFLPLTHVFERLWCYYLLYVGSIIYINHNPTEIQTTLKEVRPSLMCAVPRFWEKVYIGVKEVLSGYTLTKLAIVTWALEVGKKHNINFLRIGKKPDFWLSLSYKVADKQVYSKLKTTLGQYNDLFQKDIHILLGDFSLHSNSN